MRQHVSDEGSVPLRNASGIAFEESPGEAGPYWHHLRFARGSSKGNRASD